MFPEASDAERRERWAVDPVLKSKFREPAVIADGVDAGVDAVMIGGEKARMTTPQLGHHGDFSVRKEAVVNVVSAIYVSTSVMKNIGGRTLLKERLG